MLGLYYIKETGVGAPDVEMDMLYFMLRMSLQLGGEGDEHAGSNYRPMQHIQGVKAIGATEFASGTGKTSLRGVKGRIETYWIEKWVGRQEDILDRENSMFQKYREGTGREVNLC